jgi:mono/diheme cytochrome c family protein
MIIRLAFAAVATLILCGCDRLPGRPGEHEEIVRPEQVLDFNTLYRENCSGCHGPDGKGGAAIALRNPIFLAIAGDETIRKVVAGGVPGTQLAPFALSKGGMLTDEQIDVLIRGIRAWARPDQPRDGIPAYAAPAGDPRRGSVVYATFCSSCHGPDGRGGKEGSSITDGAYLALVSDQYLRTLIIAGRPELGAPDWRGNVSGRPMTSEEISDVVAWLANQRSTSK